MDSQLDETQPFAGPAGGATSIRVEEACAEEVVVAVEGLLKFDTVDAVKRDVEVVLGQTPAARLTIDCSKVDFVDSQALAMLIALSRRCRQGGGELALRNPRPMVQKLLHMTRMDSLFTVYNTEPTEAGSAQTPRVPLRPFVIPPSPR
jgi:anti-sigma B factor antagonist